MDDDGVMGLMEIKDGALFCKLCGVCLGEKDITEEDEQSLPSAISVHFSVTHGRDVNVEFEF